MALLLEQMYVDQVGFVDTLAPDKLINVIFTALAHRQIQLLKQVESSVKMETDGNLCTMMEDHCEICKNENWLTNVNQAISMIDHEDTWQGIVKVCKILKYPEPSTAYGY